MEANLLDDGHEEQHAKQVIAPKHGYNHHRPGGVIFNRIPVWIGPCIPDNETLPRVVGDLKQHFLGKRELRLPGGGRVVTVMRFLV